jgi:Tfp pilus assembly protein PilF
MQPNYALALAGRGAAYIGKADYDRAIADLNQALRVSPNYAFAITSRGDAYRLARDFNRALDDYNEALRLNPKNKEALNNRGATYVAMKKFDEAIRDLDDAIALDAKVANPHAHRARAYLGKGDVAHALADAEDAIRLDPRYYGGYLARAEAREKGGDYRNAMDDFNQALTLNSDLADARAGRDRVIAALTGSAPATPAPLPPATPIPTPTAPVMAAIPPVATPTPAPTPVAPATPAGRRVALVVANGAYHTAALTNPTVDADLITASLQKVGFAVTVKKDVTLDSFEQAINEFAQTARGADVALFYFAGHGFSITEGGHQQNLLMATNADFSAKTAFALQSGGEPIEHVEETIIGHAHATLMFIDACRNVPMAMASRSIGTRGFAPIDSSAFDGAFVVVSTREGKTAADGVEGQGSPFARAVAAVLPTPRMRIEDEYYRIREKVRADTSGEQVPDVIRSDLPEGGLVLSGGDAH